MANELPEELRKANRHLWAGETDQARSLLMGYVRQNPNSEEGWYLLSQAMSEPKTQLDCLKQVLRINPANIHARRSYEQLAGKRLPPVTAAPLRRRNLRQATYGDACAGKSPGRTAGSSGLPGGGRNPPARRCPDRRSANTGQGASRPAPANPRRHGGAQEIRPQACKKEPLAGAGGGLPGGPAGALGDRGGDLRAGDEPGPARDL